MSLISRDDCRLSRTIQWFSLCLWSSLIVAASGCQCWGPSATCLRPEGPIAGRAELLRQQHLERSHYYRDVPMFDHYLDGSPDPHQQVPSRFHPVPTRNVFQSPNSGFTMEQENSSLQVPPSFENIPGRIPAEELPPPQPRPTDLNGPNPASPSLESPGTSALELGPQASSDLLHRQMIQYPYAADSQQRVADWVQGNYSTGTKESLRLHSVLRTPATDLRYR